MHEKIMRGLKKIDDFFDRALGSFSTEPLPTLEELQLNFPHQQGCSQSLSLKPIERLFPAGGGGWGGGLTFATRYLRCDECHVTEEYRKGE